MTKHEEMDASVIDGVERMIAKIAEHMRGSAKGLFDQRNVALAVTHGEDMIHRFREAIRIGGLDSGPPNSIVEPSSSPFERMGGYADPLARAWTERGMENCGSMPTESQFLVEVLGEEGDWSTPVQAGSLIWSREHDNPIVRWRRPEETRNRRPLRTFSDLPNEASEWNPLGQSDRELEAARRRAVLEKYA